MMMENNENELREKLTKMWIKFGMTVTVLIGLFEESIQIDKCKQVADVASRFYDLGPQFSDAYLTELLANEGYQKGKYDFKLFLNLPL